MSSVRMWCLRVSCASPRATCPFGEIRIEMRATCHQGEGSLQASHVTSQWTWFLRNQFLGKGSAQVGLGRLRLWPWHHVSQITSQCTRLCHWLHLLLVPPCLLTCNSKKRNISSVTYFPRNGMKYICISNSLDCVFIECVHTKIKRII